MVVPSNLHEPEQVKKCSAIGVVESVKAASDLYSPVSGEILGMNETLKGRPELVNEDAPLSAPMVSTTPGSPVAAEDSHRINILQGSLCRNTAGVYLEPPCTGGA